jgi:predicted nucleotidyltransferase
MNINDQLTQLIEIAENTPVIKRLWVFGSRYKGTNSEDSDLDIAVEVEWVKGQMLGVCENSFSLWVVTSRKFEYLMKDAIPWNLDLQQYVNEAETPNIHQYLQDSSKLLYEKA